MISQPDTTPVVNVTRSINGTPMVIACEHASHHIPADLAELGLDEDARYSHAAWDPGALAVATRMTKSLDATLVASTVSRLVYDCNRPENASDAIRETSEVFDVPGNRGLSEAQRKARAQRFYRPFRDALSTEVARHRHPVLLTIHSFTPVYDGRARSVEIGILHDVDARLADALLDVADTYVVRRNEPYGPADNVTHTLREHAVPGGLLNAMIEIRNDLIATPDQQVAMADLLIGWVRRALALVEGPQCKA